MRERLERQLARYFALARRENLPFAANVDLPREMPVDEMDMCLVLANLLENALEASLKTPESKRHIRLETYLHSTHLLIRDENGFDGNIRTAAGVFLSSKRKRNGVGIESVRRIAEKCGGYSSFEFAEGTFTAKVMLRG